MHLESQASSSTSAAARNLPVSVSNNTRAYPRDTDTELLFRAPEPPGRRSSCKAAERLRQIGLRRWITGRRPARDRRSANLSVTSRRQHGVPLSARAHGLRIINVALITAVLLAQVPYRSPNHQRSYSNCAASRFAECVTDARRPV